MPHQDPATPPEEPTVGDGPAQDTAIQAQQAPGHEPAAYEEPPAYEPAAEEDIEEGDEWLRGTRRAAPPAAPAAARGGRESRSRWPCLACC